MYHSSPLTLNSLYYSWISPTIRGLLAAICFSLLTGASLADDEVRWYQLEILAFSNNPVEAFTEELWPANTGDLSFSQAIDILPPEPALPRPAETETTELDETVPPPGTAIPAYTQLFASELELTGLAARLARSKTRNLLLHTGWRQPLIQNQTTGGVFIDDLLETPVATPTVDESQESIEEALSPEDLLKQALMAEEAQLGAAIRPQTEDQAILPFADRAPSATLTPQASEGPNARVLDTIPILVEGPPQNILFGTATLRWSRFLHLQMDFIYRSLRGQKTLQTIDIENLFPLAEIVSPAELTEEIKPDDSETIASQFRLNDSRRIKTNKLYYFDHPLFGLLVQIKPYEPVSEPESLDEPAAVNEG